MAKIVIPSGSGEVLFVTDQSASLDFRNTPGFRTGSGVIGKWEIDPDDDSSLCLDYVCSGGEYDFWGDCTDFADCDTWVN